MAAAKQRVGVAGGGQLGALLVSAGERLGIEVHVLDLAPRAPAREHAARFVQGSWEDPAALAELADGVDVVTIERDDVSVAGLAALVDSGVRVEPSPAALRVIQDKLAQREHHAARGLPLPRFAACDEPSAAALAEFGFPLVQKARRGGYDGQGVLLHPEPGIEPLQAPSLLEEMVPIARELTVLVARDRSGGHAVYPVCEVDVREQRLDLLTQPARLEPALAAAAQELALAALEGLPGAGIAAVELFLTEAGQLLINEVSLRTHNSGHVTLDANETDQFEQHLRAVAGLPLGSVRPTAPAAALANIVGSGSERGPAEWSGLEVAESEPGVTLHRYAKAEVWPGRKMGHLTVCGEDIEEVRARARAVQERVRVAAARQQEAE